MPIFGSGLTSATCFLLRCGTKRAIVSLLCPVSLNPLGCGFQLGSGRFVLESLPTARAADPANIWHMSVQSSASQSGTGEIAADGSRDEGDRPPVRRRAGLLA